MDENSTTVQSPSVTRRRCLSLLGGGLGVGLAGCSSQSPPRNRPDEGTITIGLLNRDGRERAYEVVVSQGDSVRSRFSGVLPAAQAEPVELVATFRVTDEQYDFAISTTGGQRGQTWDPDECADFSVDAFIENGVPGFDVACRSE